ncbi:MAG: DUF1800 domain-containing protein [Planctomycetes bacterium]|nr:DUF1800 domain-containing protein [Planctomycetota bacterium]
MSAKILLVFGFCVGALLAQNKVVRDASAPLSEDENIVHALSRLTWGARPQDIAAVKAVGLSAWIEQQLSADPATDTELSENISRFKTLGRTFNEINQLAADGDQGQRDRMRQRASSELKQATVLRALHAQAQLHEVLADFWRNHFNVDVSKESVALTATHYEERALRPHIFGKFADMLTATAHHPAMLVYLDNALSRRPPPRSDLRMIERRVRRQTGSAEAAREQVEIARQSGLNENYARELMELHTLGVDNGYTQKDVTEVARAFTGWSVDFSAKEGTGFSYKEDMHDTEPKVVFGKGLQEGRREDGINEGEAVLKRLCAHENTAEFIAKKLTRWLVNDTPPAAVISAAKETFRTTKGDLRAVVKTIITHADFNSREHFMAKFKTPFEFVVSALRVTDATVVDANAVVEAVDNLGLRIYGMEDPTGWAETAEAWRDPGVMALRWRFALALSRGTLRGVVIPPAWFSALPADPLELGAVLAARVVPQGLGPATASVVERLVFQRVSTGKASDAAGRDALAKDLVGVLLGSPEFQQQ